MVVCRQKQVLYVIRSSEVSIFCLGLLGLLLQLVLPSFSLWNLGTDVVGGGGCYDHLYWHYFSTVLSVASISAAVEEQTLALCVQ